MEIIYTGQQCSKQSSLLPSHSIESLTVVQFKSLVQKLTRGIAFGAMFLLLPMMFLSAADVTLRKLFTTTVPGTMELSSYMMALFILLGLSYTHQCRAHVRVSFLLGSFSR